MDPALRQAIDDNFYRCQAVGMGCSRPGESAESHDLILVSCGVAATNFDVAIPRLPVSDPDAAIDQAEAWFGARGLAYRFTLPSPEDPELEARLLARGYLRHPPTPGMLLDPIRGGERRMAGLEIQRVTTAEALADFQSVAFRGFGLPERAAPLYLTERYRARPESEFYLGLLDKEPVATSALFCTPGVAGIYWVSTLESQRGKGLGEALTWAALQGGIERGLPVASLQASAMGRPVYERMGFRTVAHYTGFELPAA